MELGVGQLPRPQASWEGTRSRPPGKKKRELTSRRSVHRGHCNICPCLGLLSYSLEHLSL